MLWHFVRAWRTDFYRTVNFDTDQEEHKFVEERMKKLIPLSVFSNFCIAFLAIAARIRLFVLAISRQDFPFRWSRDDPRTQYFIMSLAQAAVPIFLNVITCLRGRFGFFKALNYEALVVFVYCCVCISGPFASTWHVASYWNIDDDYIWGEDQSVYEPLSIYYLTFLTIAVLLYVPIRVTMSWPFPVSAVLTLVTTRIHSGTPYANGWPLFFVTFTCSVVLAYVGAWRHEKNERKRWKDIHHERKMRVGMQRLMQFQFDAVARLDENLVTDGKNYLRVFFEETDCANAKLDGVFGKDMTGQELLMGLSNEDGNRDKIRMTIQRGLEEGNWNLLQTNSFQQFEATTSEHGVRKQQLRLNIVDTNDGTASEWRYLVGIRICETEIIRDERGLADAAWIRSLSNPDIFGPSASYESHPEVDRDYDRRSTGCSQVTNVLSQAYTAISTKRSSVTILQRNLRNAIQDEIECWPEEQQHSGEATVFEALDLICCEGGGTILAVAPAGGYNDLILQSTDDGYMSDKLKDVHISDPQFKHVFQRFTAHTDDDRWPETENVDEKARGKAKDGAILMHANGYRSKCAAKIMGLVAPCQWQGHGTRHEAALALAAALEHGIVFIRSDSGERHCICASGDGAVALQIPMRETFPDAFDEFHSI